MEAGAQTEEVRGCLLEGRCSDDQERKGDFVIWHGDQVATFYGIAEGLNLDLIRRAIRSIQNPSRTFKCEAMPARITGLYDTRHNRYSSQIDAIFRDEAPSTERCARER